MYYVMCKDEDFLVMDKNMNIISSFLSFKEAELTCEQLNYHLNMQRVFNQNLEDPFYNTFPNPVTTNSNHQTPNQALGQTPGQISYGNIIINVPGHSSSEAIAYDDDDYEPVKTVSRRKARKNKRYIEEEQEDDTEEIEVNKKATKKAKIEEEEDENSFISAKEINKFLEKLEE